VLTAEKSLMRFIKATVTVTTGVDRCVWLLAVAGSTAHLPAVELGGAASAVNEVLVVGAVE
jgi:hypothetical protein